MSLVSVIIPAYNGEAYLKQAINSVFEQTYPDYELIIIDDGSNDRTLEVIAECKSLLEQNHYENKPLEFTCVSQTNQGVAIARNKGLEIAKGEYIAFLDQDDFWLPHKLAEQVAIFEQDQNLGLVNSGWNIVDDEGEILSVVQPWQNSDSLTPQDLIIWKPIFLGAMLFRRSWLDKTTGFKPRLAQTSDVELGLSLGAIACPGAWLKQATVNYRQHEDNVSNNTLKQAEELNQMLEDFFARPELAPEIKALEAESRYQSLVWSAWRLSASGNLVEMGKYLTESCKYIDKYPTEVVISWVQSFQQYASEYGKRIDVKKLSSSQPWQDLINSYVLS